MAADSHSEILKDLKKFRAKMPITKGTSFAQLPDEIIEQ
jgi:hypothetical protein